MDRREEEGRGGAAAASDLASSTRRRREAPPAQAKKPAEAPGDEKADEGKDDEKRPRRGARRRGAAPTEEKEEDDAVAELPLAARVFGALLDGAPPPKPPDGVAAAWFARAPAAPGASAAAAAAPPSFAAPRRVRDHLAAFVAAAARAEAAWAADDARKVFAEAVAAVDGALDPAALVALAEVDSSALARARLDPRTADAPDLAARLHWLAAEGAAARGDAFVARTEFQACARALLRHGGVDACVEINQYVGCTVLALSSGEEPASPRHRAGVASMAWRPTRRFSTNAP